MHEPFICSQAPYPVMLPAPKAPVSGESLAGEVGPPDLAKDQQRGTWVQPACTHPGFALSCLGWGGCSWLSQESRPRHPLRREPGPWPAQDLQGEAAWPLSSLLSSPPPQTQVPAQDDTGQGCGDPRLSPGHRDAGRLVKLQLRASESWHHKPEGRLVPSLTLPPAGSQGGFAS